MVREGQSVVYRQFLQGCAETKDQFLQAEAEARSKKLGFWNQTNPIMPWEFRRSGATMQRSTQTQPAQTQCDLSYPDVCIPPYPPNLNCSDIPHRNFRVLPPDLHKFDRDRDGIGCERK